MIRKSVAFLCLGALALSSASQLIAQPSLDAERVMKMKNHPADMDEGLKINKLAVPRETARSGQEPSPRVENTPVAIVYDNGVLTAIPGVTGFSWGNRFNSHHGAPVKSFSVTMLSFFLANLAGGGAYISVFGSGNTASTGTPPRRRIYFSGLASGWNTVTFAAPVTGGGSFLAVVGYGNGDLVGLNTTATVNGQGFHGVLIEDIVGTGFGMFTGNALLRAKTAFIPVELMDFTVSDN